MKKQIIVVILILVSGIFLTGFIFSKSTQSGGVKENGWLKVVDGKLVNSRGKAIQLRGMSSHGIVWFPQYVNTSAMDFVRSHGGNLLRVAMYADSVYGGYSENSETRKINRALMYLGIENALAANMYAIADWHLLADKNPLKTVDNAIAFFDELSKHYADEPGVIYEICNEPSGGTPWYDVYNYAMQVIPVIRKNSPNALILVGTPNYAIDLLAPLNKRLPYENVMYSYHYYAGRTEDNYTYTIGTALDKKLPVFVTEWGISNDNGSSDVGDKIASDAAYNFIEYLRENKISWANWSLSNDNESFSAIRPDVYTLHGWTESDLSPSGKIIFEALSGKQLK